MPRKQPETATVSAKSPKRSPNSKPKTQPAKQTRAQGKVNAQTNIQESVIGDGLPPKQATFVQEYLVDLNGTQAAIRAGYSKATADSQASRLLTNVKVQAAIKAAKAKRAETTAITAEMVLARYWMIATANPNDLVQFRRVNCRFCYGDDHAYQWKDDEEFLRAVRAAKANDDPVPTDEGGYGFAPNLHPHPKCPRCHGEGYGESFAQDTRNLNPQAQALYAGVKETKEGLEIKMHDQLKALDNVARHLGMFNDKLTLKGDAENPLALLIQQMGASSLPVVQENDPE